MTHMRMAMMGRVELALVQTRSAGKSILEVAKTVEVAETLELSRQVVGEVVGEEVLPVREVAGEVLADVLARAAAVVAA